MEIVPNIHVIPGSVVNCFLIVDADGLTLIDTGLPRDEKKIRNYIAGLGRALSNLRRIVITHSDGDHVGSLAALKAAGGARVYASEIEATAIASGKMSRELKASGLQKALYALLAPLFKAQPATVDEFLTDGQVLPVLGGLRVVATEGHTPGHISLFAPSVGVLFVGDSLVSEDGKLRGSQGANTWDQAKADAAVQKQAALGARIVCAGHGPVVMDAAGKFPQL
jgi:glyoxylase-like metal-dependent hydrolase (beta-lactamase superfamily II)